MGKGETRGQAGSHGKGRLPRWRPALAVGLQVMDRQHKALMARVADLGDGIAAGKPIAELDTSMAALIECATDHFRWEEKLMGSSGYGDAADHVKDHATLLQQAQLLRQELSSGAVSPGDCAKLFMDAWAAHHIARCDRPLADFIHASRPVKRTRASAKKAGPKKRPRE